MNCIWICNNYGSIKDAIGRYTFRLIETINSEYKNINVKVFSGSTAEKSKLQRIYSMEMAHAFFYAIDEIKIRRVDFVCIEYPFIEWNPFILYCMIKLSKVCRLHNCKIVLSIHEYKRSRFIRKKLIEILAKYSDVAFVTDYTNKVYLERIIKCYVRSIPSILPTKQIDISKKNYDKTFIYVWLVNKSKAFYEMLQAFVKFNFDGKKRLFVYTSSDVTFTQSNGIQIIRGASDDKLVEAFVSATFCILPSIPDISLCNSTLKVAAIAGCTIIGKFSDDLLSQCNFIVNSQSYSVDDICKSLQNAYDLDVSVLRNNAVLGSFWGKDYSFSKTANEIIDVLYKLSYPGP